MHVVVPFKPIPEFKGDLEVKANLEMLLKLNETGLLDNVQIGYKSQNKYHVITSATLNTYELIGMMEDFKFLLLNDLSVPED